MRNVRGREERKDAVEHNTHTYTHTDPTRRTLLISPPVHNAEWYRQEVE